MSSRASAKYYHVYEYPVILEKPIDRIFVLNDQLLSLVSAAILGSMFGFRVIKLNKMKSIEYPSSEVTFEVTELPLLRELMYVKLSIVPCIAIHLQHGDHPLASTSLA